MRAFYHIPQDWRYRDLPEWARYPIDGDQFEPYCMWLAVYLRSGDFPLSKQQERLAQAYAHLDPQRTIRELAESLGYLTWERTRLEDHARLGNPFSEVEKEEREQWQAAVDSDSDCEIQFEDFCTSEEEYHQIRDELLELQRINESIPHADIGIRPLLALVVKKCPTDNDAVDLIRYFYDWYNEAASK